MAILTNLEAFLRRHQECGQLVGDAGTSPTWATYLAEVPVLGPSRALGDVRGRRGPPRPLVYRVTELMPIAARRLGYRALSRHGHCEGSYTRHMFSVASRASASGRVEGLRLSAYPSSSALCQLAPSATIPTSLAGQTRPSFGSRDATLPQLTHDGSRGRVITEEPTPAARPIHLHPHLLIPPVLESSNAMRHQHGGRHAR